MKGLGPRMLARSFTRGPAPTTSTLTPSMSRVPARFGTADTTPMEPVIVLGWARILWQPIEIQ